MLLNIIERGLRISHSLNQDVANLADLHVITLTGTIAVIGMTTPLRPIKSIVLTRTIIVDKILNASLIETAEVLKRLTWTNLQLRNKMDLFLNSKLKSRIKLSTNKCQFILNNNLIKTRIITLSVILENIKNGFPSTKIKSICPLVKLDNCSKTNLTTTNSILISFTRMD